jgi:hypothetical protein
MRARRASVGLPVPLLGENPQQVDSEKIAEGFSNFGFMLKAQTALGQVLRGEPKALEDTVTGFLPQDRERVHMRPDPRLHRLHPAGCTLLDPKS